MASNIEIANILAGYFQHNYKATLLEVGAADPEMISISLPLRNLDWNIISIEPNPIFCAEFRKKNLPILEYAACAEDKGLTSFQVSPNGVSCSALEVKTLYREYDKAVGWKESDYKTIEVQAFTLNTILQKHYPELKNIDAIIIDTEGWELEVLEGFDLKKFNPKIVCLENYNNLPEYISYMSSKGYRLDRKELQDEFYIL